MTDKEILRFVADNFGEYDVPAVQLIDVPTETGTHLCTMIALYHGEGDLLDLNSRITIRVYEPPPAPKQLTAEVAQWEDAS